MADSEPKFFKIVKQGDSTLTYGAVVTPKPNPDKPNQTIYGYISKEDPVGKKTFIRIGTGVLAETDKDLNRIVKEALDEDIGPGDATTDIAVSEKTEGKAVFIAKSSGVLAGIGIAELVFKIFDSNITLNIIIEDGDSFEDGTRIAEVSGSLSSMLTFQ